MSLQPDFQPASYIAADPVDPTYEPPLAPSSPPATDPALLLRAIGFGVVGALLGAFLYAGFIHLTHIQIGYLAIGIAWLVAKGMEMGSEGRGGRPFQISAVVLTILAVAIGNALMIYWDLEEPFALSAHNAARLLQYGFEQPFLELQQAPGQALLGFFILFIGLRAAWRMTSGQPGAVRHPFSR